MPPTPPCRNTLDATFIVDFAQPDESDDSIDVAGRATRAATAEEDDDDVASAFALVPPPARFCSADTCSVRKDVTRKARRLLPSPATPSGAGLGQQADPVTDLGVNAVGHVGAEGGGAYTAGVSSHDDNDVGEGQQLRRAMSASHFDSRHIFGIYHVNTDRDTWTVLARKHPWGLFRVGRDSSGRSLTPRKSGHSGMLVPVEYIRQDIEMKLHTALKSKSFDIGRSYSRRNLSQEGANQRRALQAQLALYFLAYTSSKGIIVSGLKIVISVVSRREASSGAVGVLSKHCNEIDGDNSHAGLCPLGRLHAGAIPLLSSQGNILLCDPHIFVLFFFSLSSPRSEISESGQRRPEQSTSGRARSCPSLLYRFSII